MKKILVETDYGKGFLLDLPVEEALKLIQAIVPRQIYDGEVKDYGPVKKYKFYIVDFEDADAAE